MDLADAFVQSSSRGGNGDSDPPSRPDFALPEELAFINNKTTNEVLVHRSSPEKKGLGWFALKDIPAGTVLLVSKPLAMAMDLEDDGENDDDIDDDDRMEEEGEEDSNNKMEDEDEKEHPEPFLNSKIVLRLLEDVQKDPSVWNDALSKLYPRTKEDLAHLPAPSECGDENLKKQIEIILNQLKTHAQLKDQADDIANRLSLIVRYNVLSVETAPELLSHPTSGHSSLGGVGLYHEPSFFNHTSNPNVARYAIGDVMWFVANQDIAKDDEGCISYIEHDILCESAFRRNLMLQMDFEDNAVAEAIQDGDEDDDDGDNNTNNKDEGELDGPDMPVVDSEVQNELMGMEPLERLESIQELLNQAHGQTPPDEEDDDKDGDDNNDDDNDAGWFLCDIQNLLILQAITLDGMGQSEDALGLWEECVEFTETQLPPLDESAIVMRVQAALCAWHVGGGSTKQAQSNSNSNQHMTQAKEHAEKALCMHDKLFGGGVACLRRRYHKELQLPLRPGSGWAGAGALWPLPSKKKKKKKKSAKGAKSMIPASTLCLFAIMLNLTSMATAFVPSYPSIDLPSHRAYALQGSVADSFEEFAHQLEDSSVPEIQKKLVEEGVAFQQRQAARSDQPLPELQSSLDKVPGCVANVHVKTSLRQCSDDKWDIHIEGTADALLSRGLLAILATAISSTSDLQEILELDPYVIANKLGIRRALSPGRNDGVASMTQIIQQQIQSLQSDSNGQGGKDALAEPLYVDETQATKPPVKKDGRVQSEKTAGSQSLQNKNNKTIKSKGTVALLLSGGVDSSVALRLLLQEGYDVTAFYLKIWLEDELAHLGQCPWEDDYNVCLEVCEQAGVPLESFSLQEEYRDEVISYTIQEAKRGRTPNPDILCNSRIKFGCFYDAIEERSFDFVASGHYARLERTVHADSSLEEGKSVRLFRAPDKVKDQSYFLCGLSQAQLQRVIFPLGHLEKSEVRELAEDFELPNRHRADSQGLCFLGKVKFDEFLGAYLGECPGDIIDAATGDLLGRHRGVWFHTVGQRKGIGKVLHPLATSRGPWYVVAKNPEHNIVYCSNQYDEEIFASARSEFHVEDVKWVAGAPPESLKAGAAGRFEMKIRHGPRVVAGEVTLADSSGEEGIVKLEQKDGGLAPGQYVVFYEGEECLGGGVISERHWAKFLLDRNETPVAGADSVSMSQ